MTCFQRRSLNILAYLIFILAPCFTMGCGYHFKAAGEPVGIKIQNLSIPLITSTSSNIGFESDFTRIIRKEFISHAKVPLVSMESAQAVLTGHIVEIKTEPLTYNIEQLTVKGHSTTYEETNSRRLKIKLSIKLKDRETGKVIWWDRGMEEKASFIVGSDPLANRYNQQQALEKIARRLAKRIYLKTMERF